MAKPRASLADSLCPGLVYCGPLALMRIECRFTWACARLTRFSPGCHIAGLRPFGLGTDARLQRVPARKGVLSGVPVGRRRTFFAIPGIEMPGYCRMSLWDEAARMGNLKTARGRRARE
jgi:hypothetical protein